MPTIAASTRPGIWTRDYALMWVSRLFQFGSVHLWVPIFPLYLTELGLGPTGVGLISSVFFLTATVVRPFVAYLVDTRGARRALLLSLIPFVIAPLGYTLSTSIPLLVLFRILHGTGFSGSSAGATLVANVVPRARRGEALALYLTASNVASALSATLGVWLFFGLGARWLFTLCGLAAVTALATATLVREPGAHWGSETAPGLGPYLTRFLTRDTLALTLPLASITFVAGGVYAFLPLQAVAAGFANPGLYFTAYALALIVVRPLTGALSDRCERRRLIAPAFAPLVAALALLAWLPGTWAFYLAAVLYALGHGTIEAVMVASLVDRVPPERRGAALAQWSLFYDLGMGTGGAALGLVLAWTNQSYPLMYIAAMAIALSGLCIFIRLNPRQSGRVAAGQPASTTTLNSGHTG